MLGLTGGIACYKAAELTRALIKAGATVQVVMTEAAEQFITPVTMQALSNRTVYTSQWDAREANNMAHINLTREADAVLVAPASADFIAKLLHGARRRPAVAAVPGAADRALPAARRAGDEPRDVGASGDAAQLRAAAPPTARPCSARRSGDQACGEIGDGRMLEPAELLDEMVAFFQPKLLAGRRVLVTAGPTFEPIDPVRGLTNLSSGKMGFAVARAAAEAGADVTLVAGPVALDDAARRAPHRRDDRRSEMHDAVMAAAAQSRRLRRHRRGRRLARRQGREREDQEDARAGRADLRAGREPRHPRRRGRAAEARPFCVGFAAESGDLLANASAKRRTQERAADRRQPRPGDVRPATTTR